ncbi:MAG TPA: hypothetical protein VFS43_19270 [Polyangiaceae bacterium]|nr:hypothetical protein [Polyangiaceae bacterium]
MIACSVGLVTLGACGDDDDDNPGVQGAGGSTGTGGSGTGGSGTGGSGTGGSGTGGSGTGGSGTSGAGGSGAVTCAGGLNACAANEKCAKVLACVLACGQSDEDPPTLTAVSRCNTALGSTLEDVADVLGTLQSCQTGDACKALCGAGTAGAGGAAGAGGQGGGVSGAGGAAGGGTGKTCPPADVTAIAPVQACGTPMGAQTLSQCFACFCEN